MKKGMWIGCGLAALVGVVLCGGFLTLVAGGVWGFFALTQPVADGAGDFLSLLAQDKIPEAYASAGGVLRAQNDEASFPFAVKKLGLTDYVSSSWNKRNISNQSGPVEGTVTTKSGAAPEKDTALQFDPPAMIDPKGLLVLEGNYQVSRTQKRHFKLEYIHEAAGWKLVGYAI